MEDLSLDTPPIIIKNKPKVSLEAIPISPGFLDNTPSLPTSESDQSGPDQSVSDQSVLNDSIPIENNWKTSMIRDGFYIDFGYEQFL